MPTRTIAIVDADRDFLEQMCVLLGGAGYAIQVFPRLEGTYDALRANPPDAVIIELQFPNGQHGIDLVTVLKLRPATRSLAVILTSADAALLRVYEERLRNRAIPAIWTMFKPLDHATALHILAQALEPLDELEQGGV